MEAGCRLRIAGNMTQFLCTLFGWPLFYSDVVIIFDDWLLYLLEMCVVCACNILSSHVPLHIVAAVAFRCICETWQCAATWMVARSTPYMETFCLLACCSAMHTCDGYSMVGDVCMGDIFPILSISIYLSIYLSVPVLYRAVHCMPVCVLWAAALPVLGRAGGIAADSDISSLLSHRWWKPSYSYMSVMMKNN